MSILSAEFFEYLDYFNEKTQRLWKAQRAYGSKKIFNGFSNIK